MYPKRNGKGSSLSGKEKTISKTLQEREIPGVKANMQQRLWVNHLNKLVKRLKDKKLPQDSKDYERIKGFNKKTGKPIYEK